jgi:shikimate dehydrogenase
MQGVFLIFSERVTGMKRFGLIGSGLEHVQLRRVHSEIGDYEYIHLETDDEDKLRLFLSDKRFDGFNITHPFNRSVIKYLDELSDDAMRTQSVNTVCKLPDGRLRGCNTDIEGFRYLVNGSVDGLRCLVLGTGGAARSAAAVLEDMRAAEVVLVSRDPEAARAEIGDSYTIAGYDRLYPYYDFEIIVNCTPVGRSPYINTSVLSEARLSLRLFANLELAIDLIYNPYRTKFLQDARRLTVCNTKSGLDMLIIQAYVSRNLWLGMEADQEEAELILRKVKRKILESQLNVVAVGLPGSGKTTIFRRYAYELGLRFIDTDEETEKMMGRPIQDVVSDSAIGEDYFRAMEHKAVAELSTVRGAVIATGGGTLLNPQNRDMLKANGIVIYVKRPLDLLSIKGNPPGINIDLTQLFNDRDRIYKKTSDMVLINSRIFGDRKAKTGEGNSYNYELKGFVYFIARRVQKYLNELASDIWT